VRWREYPILTFSDEPEKEIILLDRPRQMPFTPEWVRQHCFDGMRPGVLSRWGRPLYPYQGAPQGCCAHLPRAQVPWKTHAERGEGSPHIWTGDIPGKGDGHLFV
jgi:hypothetical protein